MNLTSEVVLAIVSLSANSAAQDNLSPVKGVTVLSRVPPSPARQSFCGQTERVSTPRIVKDRKTTPKDKEQDTWNLSSLSDQVYKGKDSYRANPSFPLSTVTKLIVNAHYLALIFFMWNKFCAWGSFMILNNPCSSRYSDPLSGKLLTINKRITSC